MKLTATQLRKIIAEEVSLAKAGGKDPQRFLHGFESGHPMDDEGYMLKSRMASVKEMAETICDLLETGDQLPAWVQDLVASAHTDLEHVKDYLVGDEKLRSYSKDKTPVGMPTESSSHRGGMLLEGHARITPEEMNAWMTGDWGYVSEASEDLPLSRVREMTCEECGTKFMPAEEDLDDSLVAGRGPTVVAACPKCGCYNEDPIGKY